MLFTSIILAMAQMFYQPVYEPMPYVPQPVIIPQAEPMFTPPTHYTASYGHYYAEIPVNDNRYGPDRDTSRPIYPDTYYNDPYRQARERAEEVREAQREASYAE